MMKLGTSLAFACVFLVASAALAQEPSPRPETTLPPGAPEFTIGIEDNLEIVVWGEERLSRAVTVRPDGKITLPLVNDIYVVGMKPDEIRQLLTERLSEFVHEPNVTVIVQGYNSYRVYFVGEIGGRGARQFYQPTRVLQAITLAGGPSEFAKNEITLVRQEYGIERRIPIDYKKLLNGDPSQENIFLKPGDMLIFK